MSSSTGRTSRRSVAIKEYVDVAGAFFGPTECGMINAVLDRLARETRAGQRAKGGA